MCMNCHSASLSNNTNENNGFPIIHIHPGGFDIIVYNPEFELLLTKYCCWTNKSLITLWFVLHYKLFPVKHLQEVRKYIYILVAKWNL